MPPKKSKLTIQSSSSQASAPPPPPPLTHHIWSKLPIEIIQNIFSFTTDRGTLAAYTLVSKPFNQVATPLLWNSISGLPPSIKMSRWDPEVLNLVKIFSITNHDEYRCYHYRKTFSTIKFPNLKTLRLTFDKIKEVTFTRRNYTYSTLIGHTDCQMLHNFEPKVMTYKERGSSSFTIDPRRLRAKVCSMVETLVILISPVGDEEQYFSSNTLNDCFPNLKKVYWIYDPTVIEELDTQLDSSETRRTEYNIKRSMMDEFILLTHLLLSNPTINFTMVNRGTTNLRTPLEQGRTSIINTHEKFLKAFDRAYQDDLKVVFHLENNDREIAANHLTSRTLEEFLQLDEWAEWFDPQEIVRWQDCNKKIDNLVKKSG